MSKFTTIIGYCQKMREKYGFYYEIKCADKIKMYSQIIIDENLTEKEPDPHFAKQLCMMNGLSFKLTTPTK